MSGKGQLGEFLQARRSRLRPEDVGVSGRDEQRRVPGLRRDELALLAGVSVSYYTRLEQGQSSNASPEVLDAIARTLRLDETERRHLHTLAAGTRRRHQVPRKHVPEKATSTVRQLLAALGDTPALVLGRWTDVLAWNRAGHALFAGHLDAAAPDQLKDRPNMARLVFLDEHTRELYADWPVKARAVVGTLRLKAGRHPDDSRASALIGDLSLRSSDFAALWADHRVKAGGDHTYRMRHPLVGEVDVTQQTLLTARGQQVVVATAESGSPSHTALTLLAHATT